MTRETLTANYGSERYKLVREEDLVQDINSDDKLHCYRRASLTFLGVTCDIIGQWLTASDARAL